ncbi:MAG: response regulator receiver [Gemmataceae bacterium]|nr:response regulator receiver [Gemmataceae bacterium]
MAPDTPPTRVWLIEDNDVYRRAVARVVDGADGLTCPAAYSSCEEALGALPSADPPDVVLLDVGLPGMSGLDGIPKLVAAAPGVRVIILTVFDDDDKIFRAICAGASGYLLKMSPVEQLTGAIREVVAGGSPMNARIARRVLEMFAKLAPIPHDYGLTDRERDVLNLMVRGLIKKEIAAQLGLSVHTVDTHIRNIYEKLQVHTRSGAVAKALKEKLV